MKLVQPGFVVIHEDNAGAPGVVLGASGLLSAGEHRAVLAISLTRAAADGETLDAMLHVDDGDGRFDQAHDPPVIDATGGGPVMMVFTVSADATEPAATNL